MSDRKDKTAAELIAELAADPDYVQMRREKEESLSHRRRFRARAEEGLVEELRAAGCEVESVWDLVNSTDPYPEAVPVLIEHIQMDYPEKVVQGIARALAVPVLEPEDWQILFERFVRERDEQSKWALALALEENARREHVPLLIELVTDPENGEARSVLAEALYRLRNDEVDRLLEALRNDSEIGERISRLLATGTTTAD